MRRIALALAINLVGLSAIACDGPPVCTVVDPTGTPLNVRAGPNGAILSTLKRGAKVEVVEHKDHDGKRWALVGKYSEAWGYVFGAYLKCEGEDEMGRICTVADPTGTPLNIREEPNGKTWYAVERLADDNAIGWVFDPYLKCEEDEGH
nr:SH3 domain-containing protein [Mesorhizobium sp.]